MFEIRTSRFAEIAHVLLRMYQGAFARRVALKGGVGGGTQVVKTE